MASFRSSVLAFHRAKLASDIKETCEWIPGKEQTFQKLGKQHLSEPIIAQVMTDYYSTRGISVSLGAAGRMATICTGTARPERSTSSKSGGLGAQRICLQLQNLRSEPESRFKPRSIAYRV